MLVQDNEKLSTGFPRKKTYDRASSWEAQQQSAGPGYIIQTRIVQLHVYIIGSVYVELPWYTIVSSRECLHACLCMYGRDSPGVGN